MYDVDFVDTITTTTWKEAFPWTISILFYSLKFKQKQMIVSVSIKFPSNLISSPPELSQGTNLVSIVRIYKWSICYIYYRRLSVCLLLLPYLLWMLPLICYNFTVLMCIQCWNFPGHVSIFYKFHEYFLKLYYHCLVLLLLQQTMYLPILIINNTTLYTKLLSFPIPDHLVKCKKEANLIERIWFCWWVNLLYY